MATPLATGRASWRLAWVLRGRSRRSMPCFRPRLAMPLLPAVHRGTMLEGMANRPWIPARMRRLGTWGEAFASSTTWLAQHCTRWRSGGSRASRL